MSVQSQIDRINQNVENTYAVLQALGADMPDEQNSDNLAETAGSAKAVLYSEQPLTDEQKAQARENIDAVGVAELAYITPQMFGAKADGVTDDTLAINSAIEAAGNNGIVFFPEGKYLVSSSMSSSLSESERYIAIKVFEKENLKLILSPKAHIKHKPFTEAELTSAGTTRHYVIGIIRSSNIQVTGGKIEGEADTHTSHLYQDDGTYSRTHGYGINVYSSTNVTISGCEIFNCYGDGIHISIASGYSKSKCITIDGCNIHDCVRLGIGVTGADNTLIKNCEIHNIIGASPQAGIDFEPDYVTNINVNSVVENCVIYDCKAYAMVSAKANIGMKVRDCRLYGKITSTCDDTHPIEYINCDILCYTSSSAYRNILHNCRIASVGMYEMGDDFYNCTFNPDLFNHIVDGYGATVVSLIEGGNGVLATSFARFYNCEIVANNSGAYASNFMLWRNNGSLKSITFDGCSFLLGLHAYQGINVSALNDINFIRCVFTTSATEYTKQLIEISAPTRLLFKDNVIDLRSLTAYKNYSSIVKLTTKDTYIEGNQILAKSKLCTYPISQTFSSVGEICVLRNYIPLWDTLGSLASATASKFISAGNIISTTQSEVTFTEEDKEKLDNIDGIISNSGFITEVEAKGYTDTKVADVAAQASQQAPSFANTIEECTDTTKVYVLPDGDIYGYVMTMDPGGKPLFKDWLPLAIDSDGSIFNGVGYKTGYRLNSSGLVVQDNTGCVVAGFIPCKTGDVIRISNITKNASNNMVISYKSDFTKYGNPIYWAGFVDEGNGVYSIDTSSLPTTTAYIRISVGTFSEDTVITVNEEIVYTEPSAKYNWTNTGHSFIAILKDDVPVGVATEGDISTHNNSPDAHPDIRALLANVEVSDEKIASAIADYITKNPITGSSGRGIASIKRTSGTGAAGTTDTYTITYTDGNTSTFTVYNGTNGTNGKTAYDSAKSGGYTGTELAFNTALATVANQKTETWTFTLEDGSTVTKKVVLT